MNSDIIVSFEGASANYGDRVIVKDLHFEIEKGEFVFLVGPTGVGKSTILKLIYGDSPLTGGDIRVDEYHIASLKRKRLPYLRRKIGIVFQDFQLLPDRTVFDNIAFGLRATGWNQKQRIKQRVSEVLSQVGMSRKIHARPHQLSGGEQQRVVIARALINYPILLIADEPTGNLDPAASYRIMEILTKIHAAGTAVFMATHEYDLIRRYPARVIELRGEHQLIQYPQGESFLQQAER